jgi:hypothetical protein
MGGGGIGRGLGSGVGAKVMSEITGVKGKNR